MGINNVKMYETAMQAKAKLQVRDKTILFWPEKIVDILNLKKKNIPILIVFCQ